MEGRRMTEKARAAVIVRTAELRDVAAIAEIYN